MDFKRFEYKFQVLEHHLDTFGHVNNATYLALYEEARWDFITKNGYGLDVTMKEKKGPVILDVHCRYKREIINREIITITSQAFEMRGKIGKIKQEMIKEMVRLQVMQLLRLDLWILKSENSSHQLIGGLKPLVGKKRPDCSGLTLHLGRRLIVITDPTLWIITITSCPSCIVIIYTVI